MQLNILPRSLYNLIFLYCDLGDKLDSDLFSIVEINLLWRKYYKLTEKEILLNEEDFKDEYINEIEGREYFKCTTITIDGKELFHSINDQPAYIISKVPIKEIKYDFNKPDEDHDLYIAIWAKFNEVHRDDNFAYYVPYEYTNCEHKRIYVKNGFTRSESECKDKYTFACEKVCYSYDGTPHYVKYWAKSKYIPMPNIPDSNTLTELLKDDNPDLEYYREDGPDTILICSKDNKEYSEDNECGCF